MVLINCPECAKEISDKASACIGCGYPISADKQSDVYIMVDNTLKEINKIKISNPDWENVEHDYKQIDKMIHDCIMDIIRDNGKIDIQDILRLCEYQKTDASLFIWKIYEYCGIVHYTNEADYKLTLMNEIDAMIDKALSDKNCNEEIEMDYNNYLSYKQQERNANIPRCPTCKSANIEKIGAANKIGAVALFGFLATGHISKTFNCKNCGHKW